MEYTVRIEINGDFIPVGKISEAGFCYLHSYLESPEARAISASLPLQDAIFSPKQTKCFFDGLLPEGFSRRAVAEWMHVPEDDYIAILSGLGRECLGALQIVDGMPLEEDRYRELSLDEVKALAGEGATRSAKIVTESHLSLTGASGKVGLYFDEESGHWYQPYGTAPSTHIVKQSHVRLKGIVVNELLCLRTAQNCGISVPESFIIETGGSQDGDILFASKRYDRELVADGSRIGSMIRPYRLHQEDFAQAMGIPSQYKYEPENGNYLSKMFELLRRSSANPIEDQLKLWDMLVFNYLIGNTDNHLKNVSLLYNRSISSARLAPAYDLVSTTAYESGTRKLSVRIGEAKTIDEVTASSFRSAAAEAGLGEKVAMRHYESLCNKFEKTLADASASLIEQGFPLAGEIQERILRSGGFSKILG